VREVTLTGDGRERGRIHGEELRDDIVAGIERWRDGLGPVVGDVDAYLAAFTSQTSFRAAVERWTPDLLDEVAGLAEASGIEAGVMWAFQLMDEEWWFREQYSGGRGGEHCSSVGGCRPGRSPVVAQNMDLPGVHDGSQVLLRIVPADAAEALVFSFAGFLGTTGLNADGVAVCCNSLPQLPHSPTGLPVVFVVRGVLARRDLGEAAAFVTAVPHATGQNYVLGDTRGIVDHECSALGVSPLPPTEGVVLHTNHPLAQDRTGDRDVDRDENVPLDDVIPGSSTVRRLETLREHLLDAGRPFDVDSVKATLSTPPVSVARAGGHRSMTFGSVVMELSSPPVLHLAPGPPETTPYRSYDFARS
jgi:hypothetical protein